MARLAIAGISALLLGACTSVPNQITAPGKYALRNEKAVVLDPTLKEFRDGATRIADLLTPDF